jgi:hypothetical protein
MVVQVNVVYNSITFQIKKWLQCVPIPYNFTQKIEPNLKGFRSQLIIYCSLLLVPITMYICKLQP